MKDIYLLGASGSIGMQVLDIVKMYPNEFNIKACSVGHDLDLARRIINEFKPEMVSLRYDNVSEFKSEYPNILFSYGDEGLIDVAKYNEGNKGLLVNALMGSSGLKPTVAGIKSKKDIALANKETLVMAGEIIVDLVKEYNVKLLPIDSEHSAIRQCLKNESNKKVRRLIITASGGSFRNKTREELENVTVKDALAHPNWSMGKKITIDSATMMNKGLEIIEAHFLFDIPYDKISPVLHKESIVHSMVEFNDSSIIAQLGTPDMRIPIMLALNYDTRLDYDNRLDLTKVGSLHFENLSEERFPCIKMAINAGKNGGIMPTVLNASNEAAVNLFLDGKIKFLDIEKIVQNELLNTTNFTPTLDDIIEYDEKIKDRIYNKYGR